MYRALIGLTGRRPFLMRQVNARNTHRPREVMATARNRCSLAECAKFGPTNIVRSKRLSISAIETPCFLHLSSFP